MADLIQLKNRAALVAALKDQGFAGPFTIDSIKAYCGDAVNGFSIPDKDIDDLWAKTVTGSKVEPKAESAENDDLLQKIADLENETKRLKVANGGRSSSDRAYTAATAGSDKNTMNAKNWRNISARKAYEGKIAMGRSKFGTVDQAEVAVALACTQAMGDRDYPRKSYDREILVKAGFEGTNSTGGATVPVEFNSELLYATEPFGVARQTANVVRMSRDTMTRPRKTGILAMNHAGEGGTFTGQNNTFGNVDLTAKKVGALVLVSSEWLEDSAVSQADDLSNTFREAQGIREDIDYFNGDGSSAYGNHVGLAGGLISGAYITADSATWSAQGIGNIHKMTGSVQNVMQSRLEWRCSRQWFFQVPFRLGIGQAFGSASGVQITAGQINNISGYTILGSPVVFVEQMAVAGGTSYSANTSPSLGIAAYFGDFVGASMLGDRRDLNVRFSPDRYLDTDQMAWLATARIAVNIHGDGRSASTFGPVVALVHP